ncbi:hypothetical protein C9374_009949 [Naegleria lovaniensis]|uniref:Uncharacterized protein n=1 Tax=Naegleria lovaniensis TaxID=51637 RepID=A0AA88GEZ8_NAELO|nr:uncharacterized protein C9374_009949 [Naegleria lovaniensis]KAG2375326.1 hypothetical protein C9374_009949 [Naegleria lovaniensis]
MNRDQIEDYITNKLQIPQKNFELRAPVYYRLKPGVKDPRETEDKNSLLGFLNSSEEPQQELPNDLSVVEPVPKSKSAEMFEESEFRKALTDEQMKDFNVFRMFYKIFGTKCFSYASLISAGISIPVTLFVNYRFRGLGKERVAATIEKGAWSFFLPLFIVYPICRYNKTKTDDKLREAIRGRNY